MPLDVPKALPPACPYCGRAAGTATAVSTLPGNTTIVTVTYRCPECERVWQTAHASVDMGINSGSC